MKLKFEMGLATLCIVLFFTFFFLYSNLTSDIILEHQRHIRETIENNIQPDFVKMVTYENNIFHHVIAFISMESSNVETVFRLFLALSFVLLPLSVYFFTKQKFRNRNIGLLAFLLTISFTGLYKFLIFSPQGLMWHMAFIFTMFSLTFMERDYSRRNLAIIIILGILSLLTHRAGFVLWFSFTLLCSYKTDYFKKLLPFLFSLVVMGMFYNYSYVIAWTSTLVHRSIPYTNSISLGYTLTVLFSLGLAFFMFLFMINRKIEWKYRIIIMTSIIMMFLVKMSFYRLIIIIPLFMPFIAKEIYENRSAFLMAGVFVTMVMYSIYSFGSNLMFPFFDSRITILDSILINLLYFILTAISSMFIIMAIFERARGDRKE